MTTSNTAIKFENHAPKASEQTLEQFFSEVVVQGPVNIFEKVKQEDGTSVIFAVQDKTVNVFHMRQIGRNINYTKVDAHLFEKSAPKEIQELITKTPEAPKAKRILKPIEEVIQEREKVINDLYSYIDEDNRRITWQLKIIKYQPLDENKKPIGNIQDKFFHLNAVEPSGRVRGTKQTLPNGNVRPYRLKTDRDRPAEEWVEEHVAELIQSLKEYVAYKNRPTKATFTEEDFPELKEEFPGLSIKVDVDLTTGIPEMKGDLKLFTPIIKLIEEQKGIKLLA